MLYTSELNCKPSPAKMHTRKRAEPYNKLVCVNYEEKSVEHELSYLPNHSRWSIFTTLLLHHFHSVRLFGMFFRYQWCYFCFLPTLYPSHCLVGIRDPLSQVTQHSQYKLRESQSLCGRQDPCICYLIGRRRSSYIDYLK